MLFSWNLKEKISHIFWASVKTKPYIEKVNSVINLATFSKDWFCTEQKKYTNLYILNMCEDIVVFNFRNNSEVYSATEPGIQFIRLIFFK